MGEKEVGCDDSEGLTVGVCELLVWELWKSCPWLPCLWLDLGIAAESVSSVGCIRAAKLGQSSCFWKFVLKNSCWKFYTPQHASFRLMIPYTSADNFREWMYNYQYKEVQ